MTWYGHLEGVKGLVMLAYAGTLTKYSAAVLASVAAVTRSVGGKSRIWGIADRAVLAGHLLDLPWWG